VAFLRGFNHVRLSEFVATLRTAATAMICFRVEDCEGLAAVGALHLDWFLVYVHNGYFTDMILGVANYQGHPPCYDLAEALVRSV
jgi:hypothetical protein